MRSGRAVGRIRPSILDDVRDDLAVEIDREMKRRELRLCDLGRLYGYSDRHVEQISKYLRGQFAEFGYESALALAERMGIRTAFISGAEVGEFERFLAFRRKTATAAKVAVAQVAA